MYLSLYRKYRSQSFEEVSGQEHVTRTLRNALRSDKVAHAYLFCGPRGTGKTSTARLLAKALNCEALREGEPCNECPTCTQIAEGRYLDLAEIDAASNRGIDDIRDLRDKVAFAPTSGRFKVYVIDEAHQITIEGFNALLKTLEEPPAYVVFILATTEFHKLPATIVSRCQKFDFHRATLDQLRERIRFVAAGEEVRIQDLAVDLIAREANGGWRDALSLLEQVLAFCDGEITAKDVYTVLGTVEAENLYDLANAVLERSGATLFPLLDRLIWDGKDPRQLLRDVTQHFRTLMLTAAGSPPPSDPDLGSRLSGQAKTFGMQRLLAAIEVLAHTEREARWSEEPRLLLEAALARLMHPREVPAAAPAVAAQPPAKVPAARPGAVATGGSPPPTARPPAAAPAPAPAEGVRSGSLPPPPLTLGDARTGERDDEDALTFTPPNDAGPVRAPVAAPPPRRPAQEPELTGDPDLDTLRVKWRLIGEELKRAKKPVVHAMLSGAIPDRLEQDTLVIRFPSETMAQMFAQRQKEVGPPLVEAIHTITGQQVRLRTEGAEAAKHRPRTPAAGQPLLPAEEPSPQDTVAPPVAPAEGGSAPEPPGVTLRPAARPERPKPPAAPAPPSGSLGGSELVHNVLDVFEGSIVENALELD